eukprot:1157732-Pelagomonas_calceolata.AAC.3
MLPKRGQYLLDLIINCKIIRIPWHSFLQRGCEMQQMALSNSRTGRKKYALCIRTQEAVLLDGACINNMQSLSYEVQKHLPDNQDDKKEDFPGSGSSEWCMHK